MEGNYAGSFDNYSRPASSDDEPVSYLIGRLQHAPALLVNAPPRGDPYLEKPRL